MTAARDIPSRAAAKLPHGGNLLFPWPDDAWNVGSISGGKDSTVLWLLAREWGVPNWVSVFADTGHEHPETYRYLDYLETKLGPIRRVKADFGEGIERKRKRVAETWFDVLQEEAPGSGPGRVRRNRRRRGLRGLRVLRRSGRG